VTTFKQTKIVNLFPPLLRSLRIPFPALEEPVAYPATLRGSINFVTQKFELHPLKMLTASLQLYRATSFFFIQHLLAIRNLQSIS
jgi:hypothetical protein